MQSTQQMSSKEQQMNLHQDKIVFEYARAHTHTRTHIVTLCLKHVTKPEPRKKRGKVERGRRKNMEVEKTEEECITTKRIKD